MKSKLGLALLAFLLAMIMLGFAMSWECEGVCHVLMYQDTTMFILCADGALSVDKHGKDSWELHCSNESLMPLVIR